MLQRGKESAAALSVIPLVERVARLQPPASLSEGEASLFRQIVAQCSADHFTPSDTPLLVAYCQAVLLSRYAFKQVSEDGAAFQIWQQAARTLATLATKLRLCPHSRTDPKIVGRRSRGLGITAQDYLDMVSE
jgi:phage terminase small subunit